MGLVNVSLFLENEIIFYEFIKFGMWVFGKKENLDFEMWWIFWDSKRFFFIVFGFLKLFKREVVWFIK